MISVNNGNNTLIVTTKVTLMALLAALNNATLFWSKKGKKNCVNRLVEYSPSLHTNTY